MPGNLEGKHRRHGIVRRVLVLGATVAGFCGAASGAARAGDPTPASAPTAAPASTAPAVQPAALTPPPPPKPSAKIVFGAVKAPAALAARAIGYYSRGCLAGAKPLPTDGRDWQVMRLSRNRNWGTPELVAFIEHFAEDARRFEAWPGLLVGDMSQPRGGPMLSGHASHQVGLDVDLWYLPMPAKVLSRQERENTSAISLVTADQRTVDPTTWSNDYEMLLKRAASFGEVERIFVHPAIKEKLCQLTAKDLDRSWLAKIRPFWGHNDHFHVRIKCPEGMASCKTQAPVTGDIGCDKEVANWLALVSRPTDPNAKPEPPRAGISVDALPHDCQEVLVAPSATEAHR